MNIVIKVDTGKFDNVVQANKAQDEIDWWDERDARAVICTNCFLALDLKSQLEKVVKSVSINTSLTDNDVIIYIGGNHNQIHLIGESGQLKSYVKDEKRVVELYGNSREGTINAVYEFLLIMGFRYYNTDSYSSIIPKKLNFKDVDYITKPDFVTRGCYNAFADDENHEFIEWMTRNRMNMLKVKHINHACELKKRGIKLLNGGHEIYFKFLNPNKQYPYTDDKKTYFDVHPEWFALIDGKRSNKTENKQATEGYYTGDNICTSNIDGVSELAKNMIEALNDGYLKYCDLLNFWAYDNGTWCDCEACQKTGNYATRMLLMAYYISKEIKKAYEEKRLGRIVKLVIPIYHETLIPPVIDLPDDFDYQNVIITYFPIERCYNHYINDENCTESNVRLNNLFKSWAIDKDRKYLGEVFIGEYFNVSSFASLPFIFTDVIKHDLPYYFENNTRHFYYMHISTVEWGMLTMNNYLIARLLWDINSDAESIQDEYYDQVYPVSKEKMKQFHKILETASKNAKYLKHYQFDETGTSKPSLMWNMFDDELFPLKHCQFDKRVDDPNSGLSFTEMIELFDQACELITTIEKNCSAYEKQAIEIEKMRFDYGFKVMNFLYHLVMLRFAHMNNEISEIKKQFEYTEAYRKVLEKIKRPIKDAKYEIDPWLNDGFNATWVAGRYMEYRKKIIELIN